MTSEQSITFNKKRKREKEHTHYAANKQMRYQTIRENTFLRCMYKRNGKTWINILLVLQTVIINNS